MNNDDLATDMWGSHFWISLHSATFGFPTNPTRDQKKNYKIFFESVAHVLPCHRCRDHYKKIITSGDTKITDAVFENRDSLTKWLYLVHEAVNRELKVNYNVSYDDVVKRYNAYRSTTCQEEESESESDKGCAVPANTKLVPIDFIKDMPVLSADVIEHFFDYAKKRNVSQCELKLFKQLTDPDFKQSYDNKIWQKRNKECNTIIQNMKMKGMPSTEDQGKWTGLPTVTELRLLMRLCSNLSINELNDMIKKLPYKSSSKKIYRLTKQPEQRPS
jgi:hypothetical protein